MKKITLFVVLAGTFLSSASYAQTATSGSGSVSESNASSNSSPTVNTSAQAGSQSIATTASQSGSSSTNAGNAQSITSNSYAPDRQTIVAAPSVFAPALTTTLTETCMGSTSLGVSVLGFGASGGSTWKDNECVRRLNARELAQTLNDREAAREVICGNNEIFRAYNALGRPCRLTPDGSPNPAWSASLAAAPPPPPPVAPAIQESRFTVFFDFASAAITAEAAQTLDRAAAAYQQSGNAAVVVAGHTDRAGSATYNETLSMQRAEAVGAYLIDKGVPQQVQKIVALGEASPSVQTGDGVPEARNRRVEITFGDGAGI